MQNHWCLTINNDPVATFVSQAKMHLRQVSENQNNFKICLRVWCHPVRSQWVCIRSEVSSGACLTFRSHDEYAWGQRLGFFIRGQNAIEGLTCPKIDLWPHADSLWPRRMTPPPIKFQTYFDFYWLGATAFFARLTKIATELLLTVTHQWFFNGGKTRCQFI